jgi:hypothetical protein
MSYYEKRKLEIDLRNFTNRNFEKPTDCKNAAQISFYVSELCAKIEEYERRFNYVPAWAYSLLTQYTVVQNRLVHIEFVKTYC